MSPDEIIYKIERAIQTKFLNDESFDDVRFLKSTLKSVLELMKWDNEDLYNKESQNLADMCKMMSKQK